MMVFQKTTKGKSMKIGELSEKTGLSIDTLRFYEKIGLIPAPWRNSGGTRVYDPEILGWVNFLKALKATGMPLAKMQAYAEMRARGMATAAPRRIMLEKQRDIVRARITELAACLDLLDFKIDNYHDIERRHAEADEAKAAQHHKRISSK
jgi:DNA-binding transcriptional MerR regulator